MGARRGTRMLPCSLVSGKEEKLVGNDLAANGAAELVAEEGVTRGGRGAARRPEGGPLGIESPAAVEIKHVAMQAIRARFRHQVNDTAWMQPVAGRQGTCLHAEFLQRIRKRKREIHVRKCVVVVAAIQEIVGSVGLAAGYGNRHRTVETLASHLISPGRHHGSS